MSNNLERIKSNIYLPDPVNKSLRQCGIRDYRILEDISSGRNSNVLILDSEQKKYVIKKYFCNPHDSRNRLRTEFDFLELMDKMGIACVPKSIGFNQKYGYGFYSYVEGVRIEDIQDNHITMAANFIKLINEKYKPSNFQLASEACFTYQDFLKSVRNRIRRLLHDLNGGGNVVEENALNFLEDKIIPKLRNLEKEKSINLYEDRRILSPSDFGFHNMLEYNGRINFIDFEYAGEDGITKLIGDFVCQPDKRLTKSQADFFIGNLSGNFDINLSYLNKIIAITRLKWTCLILNVFHDYNLRKERVPSLDKLDYQEQRLDKAMNYFTNYAEDIN